MNLHIGLTPRALKRAMVRQRFLGPDDAHTVEQLFSYLEQTRPTMTEIKDAICDLYLIERKEIEGGYRRRFLVLARHMFCFFSYRYARASLNQIKERIGYADHTSVYHGIRMIEQQAITNPLVRDDLDLLRLRICEKILRRRNGSAQC